MFGYSAARLARAPCGRCVPAFAEAGRLRAKTKPEAVRKVLEPKSREILLAEQVVALYAAGEPAGYLAAALGVPAKRVYRLLRERGVLRTRSEARKVV